MEVRSPKSEGRKKAETRIPNRVALAVRRHNEVPIRSLRFLLFSSWNNFGARNLAGVAGHARRFKNTHT